MDGDLDTERESLGDEGRRELCLVQIDIAGHSKLRGTDRTLKAAKKIFSREIKQIAEAQGGKLLNWAGDGGSYMFTVGDGEGFDRLVRAALVMLFSMPAINIKIAKKTDLKDTFHVRISCHSGNVAYDQDPTLITGRILNDFLKNEREISLVDTVSITGPVYEQLEPLLRDLFTLRKRSSEIGEDIYTLIEGAQVILIENLQASPATANGRKIFLAGAVLGIALGIICTALIPRVIRREAVREETAVATASPAASPLPDQKEKNTVIIIGSGTVYLYLKALEENPFDSLRKRKENNIDVQILEGPTKTGAKMFSYAYEQVPILVMASDKLTLDALQRYKDMPKAVFEAYLGADPIQILLVAERNAKNAEQDDTSILAAAFADPGFNGLNLTIEEVIQTFARRDKKDYQIYAGSKDSGTRGTWDSLVPKGAPWPSEKEIMLWESSSGQESEMTGKPRLYLGSRIQNERVIKMLDGLAGRPFVHKVLPIVDAISRKPKTRGLFLYGLIEEKSLDRNTRRFYLDKPVAVTLEYIYSLLKDPEFLNQDCRARQIEYFHLGPSVEGWVSENTHKGGVYQIPFCAERP